MRSRTAILAAALGLCASAAALAGGPGINAAQVTDGLMRPVFVTHAPGDFERIFIVEQRGRIYIMNLATGTKTLFLNIEAAKVQDGGNEQGLLGLAFHPDHFENGYFYVNYTALSPNNDTVIARYRVREEPSGELNFNIGDSLSELRMWIHDQPFTNHNGGWIAFAPPGVDEGNYLYIATGDGGLGNDPNERAQDITDQPLGKMLRIDVDTDAFPDDELRNYGIPASNPFVGIDGDDEIWHYGLRNPWRDSFDRETGDLIIGDVGQDAVEEVDFQAAHAAGTLPGQDGYGGGLNFGWDCKEGNNCIASDAGCSCADPTLTNPIHAYAQGVANCSVTGGYVYRGCAIDGLQGTYFFADVCSNIIWSFMTDGTGISDLTVRTAELDPPGVDSITSLVSFGEDAFGEIYMCDLFGGEIFKIMPDDPITDCNENLIEDACEIAAGLAADANANGIPDVCEKVACPVDLDASGTIDSADLNGLLAVFGQTIDHPADFDDSGTVDSADLNQLLALFGQPCP